MSQRAAVSLRDATLTRKVSRTLHSQHVTMTSLSGYNQIGYSIPPLVWLPQGGHFNAPKYLWKSYLVTSKRGNSSATITISAETSIKVQGVSSQSGTVSLWDLLQS